MIRATLCSWILLAVTAFAAEEQIIQQFTGNGTRSTRPFTVQDRWELRWDARGTSLQIYEVKPDGEPISLAPAASQTKPGSGSSYRPKGNTLYLRILSDGDWTITVVQLP